MVLSKSRTWGKLMGSWVLFFFFEFHSMLSPYTKVSRVHDSMWWWWWFVRVHFAGKLNVQDEELDGMLNEGKGPINFTVFLTLFGEKLNGTIKTYTWTLLNETCRRCWTALPSYLTKALIPRTPSLPPSNSLTPTALASLTRTSKTLPFDQLSPRCTTSSL